MRMWDWNRIGAQSSIFDESTYETGSSCLPIRMVRPIFHARLSETIIVPTQTKMQDQQGTKKNKKTPKKKRSYR